MAVTIIQSDDTYKLSVKSPDYKITSADTHYKIGVGSISGYGPKGDKGDKGDDGNPASIADVPGLQEALDGKAALIHTHILDDITDFNGTVLSGGAF